MELNMQGPTSNQAAIMLMNEFDPGALRPFIGNDGRHYLTVNAGGKKQTVLTQNANATMTYEEWRLLDEAVVKAAKPRLRAVADLRASGLQYTIPQGMGKSELITQTQSDITRAQMSFDGLADSRGDRPLYGQARLPLPIIHFDFTFPARQVMISRNGNNPLDTTMAELASRRVAELAEQLLLGTSGLWNYDAGSIYGYTNFPSRLTYTPTLAPGDSSWTPAATLQDVLNMRLLSQQHFHFGPWVIYNSTDWDAYLDDDFKVYAQGTLRERIKKVEGIQDLRTVDYLPSLTMVMVQMTTDVVREVVGMDVTTVQWETHGGMQNNFKVMAILVPQLRADFNGNTGIVHATSPGGGIVPTGISY